MLSRLPNPKPGPRCLCHDGYSVPYASVVDVSGPSPVFTPIAASVVAAHARYVQQSVGLSVDWSTARLITWPDVPDYDPETDSTRLHRGLGLVVGGPSPLVRRVNPSGFETVDLVVVHGLHDIESVVPHA